MCAVRKRYNCNIKCMCVFSVLAARQSLAFGLKCTSQSVFETLNTWNRQADSLFICAPIFLALAITAAALLLHTSDHLLPIPMVQKPHSSHEAEGSSSSYWHPCRSSERAPWLPWLRRLHHPWQCSHAKPNLVKLERNILEILASHTACRWPPWWAHTPDASKQPRCLLTACFFTGLSSWPLWRCTIQYRHPPSSF